MDIRQLPLDELVLDPDLNLRDRLDDFTVERYVDAWDRMPPVTVFEVGSGGPGTEVHLEIHPELPFHRFVGIGGVHHVAFRTPNEEEHRQWRDRIATVNPTVTPVIDRFYFRSIYFREPGGVLFELATDGPDFAIDEDVVIGPAGRDSQEAARCEVRVARRR